jgi:UDP-glucose 4-epimerase
MRVLVTGGAGYVGSASVEALIVAGHDVAVLDDLSTGHRAAVPAGVTLEAGSYADTDTVVRLIEHEQVDAILHCAARSLVGESIRNPARYYRDNVAGGIALLAAGGAAAALSSAPTGSDKVAVTVDSEILNELDELIAQNRFPNRSQAIEAALREKLERLSRARLARECAKLDTKEEKALAEEGLRSEVDSWPAY